MSIVSIKIRKYCKLRGIRCPEKKLLVADYLHQSNDFVDAGNLYLALRNNYIKISPATVYQSLNWLIETGFVECRALDSKNFYKIID